MNEGRVNAPQPRAGNPTLGWLSMIDPRRVGWLRLLLVFLPAAAASKFAGAPDVLTFALAATAIIPLAGLIGESTESLSKRMGPGIGGLLNATFGNAAELIIALFALFNGLDSVVKASLTGSIIGNLLLVMGASFLAGGIRHRVQRFNRTAAGSASTLMVLAAMGMLVPAIFDRLVPTGDTPAEHDLSLAVSVLLIITYGLSLLFSLVTHRDLYNPAQAACDEDEPSWTTRKSVIVLVVSTAFVAWMSEILVGAVEGASHSLGLTEIFVGVIVVAIVGNAAEHSTAVMVAWKNKADLAVGIAMGSALQIALFVAPVLVFVSHLRPHPMDLLFTPLEVAAVVLAVILARMVAEDGESNWLEGAMLLMIYAILATAFFYFPEPKEKPQTHQATTISLPQPPAP